MWRKFRLLIEKNMESTINQRFTEYIKSLGMSIRKFEALNGLSNGYVKSVTRGIGEDKLRTISLQNPKLNIEWLLTGKGEMF